MRRILVLAGLLGGALPAFAQSPLPDTSTQSATPVFDDAIVVTAAATDTSKETTPATVSVVTAPEIAARQATTVSELLRTVPGLALSQSGSAGHATSLFTRGTDSNQTLVLWNGVPLNEPYIGGFDWSSFSTDGLERVEIVRGPFSALYGSGALGGVVQMLGGAPQGLTLRVEGGDHGWQRAGLVAGTKLGEVELGVSGHLQRSDGELENDFFDSDAATATARWSLAPGSTLGVLARWNDAEIGIPRSGSELTPHQRQHTTDLQVAVPLTYQNGPWALDTMLSHNSTDLAYRDPDSAFGYTAADTETATNRARADGSYAWGASTRLTLGGDWQRQEVTDSSVFGSNLDGVHRRQWGAFGELHWTSDRLTVDAGVRRDDDETYGGHTSPRLGARLALGAGWSLRGSYGEAFRAPSFSELYYPFSGNLELRPETTSAGELGVAWEGKQFSLRATGFRNRLKDLIDFDFSTFTSVNVGRARTQGVEAEAAYSASHAMVRLNATFLDAENLVDGTDLLNRPKQSASLLGVWRPDRFTVSATVRYAGERRSYPYIALPSYTVADLALAWQGTERLQPYVRLLNAFDKRYEEVAGYPAPRRAWVGGLAVRF